MAHVEQTGPRTAPRLSRRRHPQGTGRTAGAISDAAAGRSDEPRAQRIARSEL